MSISSIVEEMRIDDERLKRIEEINNHFKMGLCLNNTDYQKLADERALLIRACERYSSEIKDL